MLSSGLAGSGTSAKRSAAPAASPAARRSITFVSPAEASGAGSSSISAATPSGTTAGAPAGSTRARTSSAGSASRPPEPSPEGASPFPTSITASLRNPREASAPARLLRPVERPPSSGAAAITFVAARTAAINVASSGALGSASGSGVPFAVRARTSTRNQTGALGVITTGPPVTRIGASTSTGPSPRRRTSARMPPISR